MTGWVTNRIILDYLTYLICSIYIFDIHHSTTGITAVTAEL